MGFNIKLKKRGFILIVVIGLLSTLSFLALNVSYQSSLSKSLSNNFLNKSKSLLLARSGVEFGIKKSKGLSGNGFYDSNGQKIIFDGHHSSWMSSLDGNYSSMMSVRVKDASSTININDGIQAGRANVVDYLSSAVDPWPENLQINSEGTFDPATGVLTDLSKPFLPSMVGETIFINGDFSRPCQIVEVFTSDQIKYHPAYQIFDGQFDYSLRITDFSALNNLRLRRLLNAYGDVHKFKADKGAYPAWNDYGLTYGSPVTFTSTATADNAHPQPGSTGLGDAIISIRPEAGFNSLSEVKDIVNVWGETHLTEIDPNYLKKRSFYEFISSDLTVSSFVDNEFFRMKREFGTYSSKLHWDNGDVVSLDSFMMLERGNINLGDLWERHPIHPINLNAASFEVRAAVFYAPCHVSYLVESGAIDSYELSSGLGHSLNPGIAVRPPLFSRDDAVGNPVNPKENGMIGEEFSQAVRLMSLCDAMVLSDGYKYYCENFGYPYSFTEFAYLLKELEINHPDPTQTMMEYERAMPVDPPTYNHIPHSVNANNEKFFYFRQTYVEKTLPHIFSCVRRVPSWLGAPVSLLSPYLEPYWSSSDVNKNKLGLISVDDFVFKFHLPKTVFLPAGQFKIQSTGRYNANHLFESSIDTTVDVFKTQYFRTQRSFELITDHSNTDSRIKIGPEPWGAPASPFLGTVGLWDRRDQPIGHYPYSLRAYFDDQSPNNALGPENPMTGSELVIPFLNSTNEAYLTQSVINVTHQWPGAFSSWSLTAPLPQAHNFDPAFANAINSPSNYPGKTWKLPHDSAHLARVLTAGPALFSLGVYFSYYTQVILGNTSPGDFVINHWSNFSSGGPAPSLGSPIEKIFWMLLQQGAHPALNISWSGSSKSFLSNTWSNGDPSQPLVIDNTQIGSSQLEDESVSFFDGSDTSNISPFNGIFLSSLNHGFRSSQNFSDSLLFRPYYLIDPDYRVSSLIQDPNNFSNSPLGESLSKGLISFWYRVPTGVKYGNKMLFHFTFWENAKLGNTATYNPATAYGRIRPNYLYAWLDDRNRVLVGHASVRDVDQMVSWAHSLTLPQVDYPNSPNLVPGQNYNYFGVPDNQQNIVNSPLNPHWFYNGTTVEGFRTLSEKVPGSWQRLIIGWNYRDMSNGFGDRRFWAFDGARPMDVATSGVASPLEIINSNNPEMLGAFGEVPYFNHRDLQSYSWAGHGGPPKDKFQPVYRLNSLIDNIDMRFGDHDGSWFGFSGASPLFMSQVKDQIEDASTNYFTWRYPIYPGDEPKWVIDFSEATSQFNNSGRIITIGARIYDVPSSNAGALYPISGNAPYNPAPRVDLNVEQPLHTVIPETMSMPAETPGYLFQKWYLVSSHSSQAYKVYDNLPITSDSRMTLTYKCEMPSGQPLSIDDMALRDIPWIQEISCRYIPGGSGSSIISWLEN